MHSLRYTVVQALGAYKLARFAYDRLQQHRIPPSWQDAVDLDMLAIQVDSSTISIKYYIITSATTNIVHSSSQASVDTLCAQV